MKLSPPNIVALTHALLLLMIMQYLSFKHKVLDRAETYLNPATSTMTSVIRSTLGPTAERWESNSESDHQRRPNWRC